MAKRIACGNTSIKKEGDIMEPDFIGLTEEKIKRIMELPYILLAQQISDQKGIEISVKTTITKNAS